MTPPKDTNLPARVGSGAPSWLVEAAEKDTSVDQVKKYRRLSRLRIVQGSTPAAKARIKEFGEGSIITVPGNTRVATAKEPFLFVPLFMFTEYCTWKDRDDESKERPKILDRSFDEAGEIALKSKDSKRRKEKYGDKQEYEMRHVEHLCFPGIIYGDSHPLSGTPVTISFEKGEYFQGTNFCSAIMLRKVGQATAPLWSQVWALKSGDGETGHQSPQYEWWGFDFFTPGEGLLPDIEDRGGAFIREEEMGTHKALAADLESKFAEQALEVDRSDADEEYVEATTQDEEM